MPKIIKSRVYVLPRQPRIGLLMKNTDRFKQLVKAAIKATKAKRRDSK